MPNEILRNHVTLYWEQQEELHNTCSPRTLSFNLQKVLHIPGKSNLLFPGQKLNKQKSTPLSGDPSPDSHRVKAVQSGRKSSFPDLPVDEIHCNDLDEVQENGSHPELPRPLKIGMLHHRHPGPDLFTQVYNLGALLGTLPAEKKSAIQGVLISQE